MVVKSSTGWPAKVYGPEISFELGDELVVN